MQFWDYATIQMIVYPYMKLGTLGVLNTSLRIMKVSKMLFLPTTFCEFLSPGSSLIHGLGNLNFHFLISTTHTQKCRIVMILIVRQTMFNFNLITLQLVWFKDVNCMKFIRWSDSFCLFRDDFQKIKKLDDVHQGRVWSPESADILVLSLLLDYDNWTDEKISALQMTLMSNPPTFSVVW